jgi:protein-disulfide isomerase
MQNIRRHQGHPGAGIALAAILLMAALPALASSDIAGQVGDKKFTIAEVDAKAKAANLQVYQALYDARRKALNAMIENQMLEMEAAARKISLEELVIQEIDSKIAKVTPEDAAAWYNENKARVGNRSQESIQVQIQQFLTAERSAEVRKAFFDTLKKKTAVKITLEPPRVAIVLAANDPYKGPKDAPVTIVEYSDFQ